mmetsp:Transcript_30712/g.60321  ORF Transcript_30712/g.60321 Transcript_30712/m.60321 type:complete len:330 (-) Transcript_30712:213-1202(-)
MPRVGRPLRLRQPTNPQPPPQDEPVLEGPTQFFDMCARDDEEGPSARAAPQIFDLSMRDEEPGREATIEVEATDLIDAEDGTEQLITNLRKDIELKNATIRHLQNALEAKSMTIGILTRATRDGGCQQLVAELQAKTAAALLEKDDKIAGLRAELDDALRLACVFGATSMVQPSPIMSCVAAPVVHDCQVQPSPIMPCVAAPALHDCQEGKEAPETTTQRWVPSLGNPTRAFSAIRNMKMSTLQLLKRQATRFHNKGYADKNLANGHEVETHQVDSKALEKMALQTPSSWLQAVTTCWTGLGQPWFRTSMVIVANKGAAEHRWPARAHC